MASISKTSRIGPLSLVRGGGDAPKPAFAGDGLEGKAEICGHSFTVIRKSDWIERRQRGEGAALGKLAGFVNLDGIRHLLFDGPDEVHSEFLPLSAAELLTSRELQIAHFVVAGKGDKSIAYELGISEYTVREHVRRIFAKLRVSKRTTLVARLMEGGFR